MLMNCEVLINFGAKVQEDSDIRHLIVFTFLEKLLEAILKSKFSEKAAIFEKKMDMTIHSWQMIFILFSNYVHSV